MTKKIYILTILLLLTGCEAAYTPFTVSDYKDSKIIYITPKTNSSIILATISYFEENSKNSWRISPQKSFAAMEFDFSELEVWGSGEDALCTGDVYTISLPSGTRSHLYKADGIKIKDMVATIFRIYR